MLLHAAISANEKGEHSEQALFLLDKTCHSGMTANVISLSAAISACEKGDTGSGHLSVRDVRTGAS